VTQVYPSQNAIVISEMNFKGYGVVDTRRIGPGIRRQRPGLHLLEPV